mmetsp:Transcript_25109/g.36889  ORF Transcript_25109/g.36889 Transcript_25109/m.36889 type:complete len:325 (+) Transcript_25109:240-1214(+)
MQKPFPLPFVLLLIHFFHAQTCVAKQTTPLQCRGGANANSSRKSTRTNKKLQHEELPSTKKTGGGMFGNKLLKVFGLHRAEENSYQKTLEEQIRLLETQIRTAREETRQLRVLLKKSNKRVISDISKTITGEKAELIKLQALLETERARHAKEIESLLAQITELERIRNELLQLLKDEKKRVAETKQQLSNTEQQARAEMEKLRSSLVEQSRQQMIDLEQAVEQRLKEEERKLTGAAEEKILAERAKGEEMVEKEKAKMRQLVKALAEREKKAEEEYQRQTKKAEMAMAAPSKRKNVKIIGSNMSSKNNIAGKKVMGTSSVRGK